MGAIFKQINEDNKDPFTGRFTKLTPDLHSKDFDVSSSRSSLESGPINKAKVLGSLEQITGFGS
jgi:hypothetical protein